MKNSILLALATAAALFSAPAVQASTVDFQDIGAGNCAYLGSGTVTSGGFNFTGNVSDPNLFGCNAGIVGNNTSNALINANSLSVLHMTANGGGTFSLDSFFAGTRFASHGYGVATGLDVLGNLFGGGTVHQTFSFVGENFSQFTLSPSFTNLTQVTFTSMPGDGIAEFVIDDIVVNGATNVPEPTSAALLSLGLAGIGFSRRRKKA